MRGILRILSMNILIVGIICSPIKIIGADRDWQLLGTDENNYEYYYDAAYFKKIPKDIKQVWIKFIENRDEVYPIHGRKNYGYSTELIEIDCSRKRFRRIGYATYDYFDNRTSSVDLERFAQWGETKFEDWKFDYSPNPLGRELIIRFCQEENAVDHIAANMEKNLNVIVRKVLSNKKLVFTFRNKETFKEGQTIYIYSKEKFIGTTRISSIYADEIYTDPVNKELFEIVQTGDIISSVPPR